MRGRERDPREGGGPGAPSPAGASLNLCPSGHGEFAAPADLCLECGAPLVPDLRGERLGGRFRATRLIATGREQSSVWEATDDAAGDAVVALKLLHHPTAIASTRFLRGADLACHLEHPNIVRVHAYGETDAGDAWVAMAYVVGAPLDAALRHRAMPWPRAMPIMDQLLAALAATHAAGVVHRDVKPGNCLVTEDPQRGRVLLGDYGLATLAEPRPLEVIPERPGSGAPIRGVCGTPEYLAPEQILGARLDGRADVYAAAGTLFRLLAGTPPFAGVARAALYRAHLGAERPRVAAPAGLPPVPARLADIVARGLARDPRDRWPSAETMRHALGTVPG